MPIGFRGLEKLSDLGREQIIFAFLVVQEVTEAALRESKPVPGSYVEIPNADCPRGFEGRLGVLVGVLVELVAERHSA